MTFAMLSDFIAAFFRAGEDEKASVVVLRVASGAFCAAIGLSNLSSVNRVRKENFAA